MLEVILDFLYTIFDFFYSNLPDIPTITVGNYSSLENIGGFINFATGGSVFILGLVGFVFILLVVDLLLKLVKFVYKSIPLVS